MFILMIQKSWILAAYLLIVDAYQNTHHVYFNDTPHAGGNKSLPARQSEKEQEDDDDDDDDDD